MARAKRAWKPRPLYLAWVIGGLIAIVAFAIVKGLSDPTDQSVIFWLIPMLAVYMGGILFMQYRQADRVARDHPGGRRPLHPARQVEHRLRRDPLHRDLHRRRRLYAGVDATFYPLGDGGPGFPAVLLPAILARDRCVGACRGDAAMPAASTVEIARLAVAEREGFEPPGPLRAQLLSRQPHSARLCHRSGRADVKSR